MSYIRASFGLELGLKEGMAWSLNGCRGWIDWVWSRSLIRIVLGYGFSYS